MRVDLGGGFKVRRTGEEVTTDLSKIGVPVAKLFADFEQETGRKLHLEIEPGTYLVARAGTLVASVADAVATGESGYKFVKLDAGMTEILRPSLYAAQHPIAIYPQSERGTLDQVIVGHCRAAPAGAARGAHRGHRRHRRSRGLLQHDG